MNSINAYNLKADKNTWGLWSQMNKEYFSNPKSAESLWKLFEKCNLSFKKELELVEFGSADGYLGKFFALKMSKNHKVKLNIIDKIEEHLFANKDIDVEKIHTDLLELNVKRKFDLGLVRSVLHYFSKKDTLTVLHNIRNSMKPDSYVLFQLFVQDDKNMKLFLKLNRFVGKKLQLISLETNLTLINQVFSKVDYIGDAMLWNCTSKNLAKRYSLSDNQIQQMKQMITNASSEEKKIFKINSEGFTVPIPYKVVLAQV